MPRPHNEVDGYAGPEAEETNAFLLEYGGESFMGFPSYRVAYSSHVLQFSGGEWCDWDRSIPADERGKLVVGDEKVPVPDSRARQKVTEMRLVRAYPEFEDSPGWLCERWMAPSYAGAPGWWDRQTVEGSRVSRLGPFPANGYYMHIGGPYPSTPTGPFLARLVEYWEAMRDEVLSLRADAYVRKRVYDAEERDRERTERWNRDASAANLEALSPFFSTSLEAGEARQRAVEHAGIHSHYGN